MACRMNLRKLISFLVLAVFGISCGYILLVYLDPRDNAILSVSKMKSERSLDNVRMGDRDDKYFWFLQLTDLHISKFSDHGRSPDLKRFAQHHVPVLSPDFILVSGDLTDAKSRSAQSSDQYPEEWNTYKRIIDESGVLKKVKWLDLRGNHDTFNVPHLVHSNNLYRTHSVQGRQHRQSYMYVHRKPYGTYSIIAMDACPNPGPKRPYNFFGVVSSSTIQLIQHYSHLSRGSNATIWFGHYPTSTIVSPGYDLRAFIGRTAVAYLCGHLHTFGRRVLSMYSLQPQGYLELELGDWRDGRMYRLAAIDHDMMSFSDETLDQWPVVLITNPKNSAYLLPHKEPVHRISQSTHIRMLVFSISAIRRVKVYIDGKFHGEAHQVRRSRPLYTVPWNPLAFAASSYYDQHSLEVYVEDVDGRSRKVRQQFSINGRPAWQFRYVPSLLISGDLFHFVRVMYYTLWITLFSPVIFMRFIHYKPEVRRLIVHSNVCWSTSLYNFSQHDFLFYPWILYLLYSACGPIIFGSVVSGGLNLVFVHGLYVNGVYIPEAFPYVTEYLQNVIFTLPLMIYFCRRVAAVPVCNTKSSLWPANFLVDVRTHWGIYVLLTIQFAYLIFSVYLPYGLLAMIFSPCRNGLLLLAWFMHRSTVRDDDRQREVPVKNNRVSEATQVRHTESED